MVAVLSLVVGAVLLVRIGWRGGADGPVITSPRDFLTVDGMAALVEGEVLIEENCVFLNGSSGRIVVVFPAGTRWSESEQAIIIGSERVREGDSIQGGGGYLSGEVLRNMVGDAAFAAASACSNPGLAQGDGPAEVAVFNRASFPAGAPEITVTPG